jgi:hypothetical protein
MGQIKGEIKKNILAAMVNNMLKYKVDKGGPLIE